MKCVNPVCRAEGKGNLVSVLAQSDSNKRLPRRFAAYNVIRRVRRCVKCGQKFHTLELPERDFIALLEKAVEKTK